MTLTGRAIYNQAAIARSDAWVPACGGTEEPFLYNGTWYLYCYNHATEEHRYLNLDNDTLMPLNWGLAQCAILYAEFMKGND